MKKKILILFTALTAITLCACGSNTTTSTADSQTENNGTDSVQASEEKTENTQGNFIDYTLDEGNVKYLGFEKADASLIDENNAYVFIFEYTNNQDEPVPVYQYFNISYFQNGVEINDPVTYHVVDSEQYDLVQAYFDKVLKGGTLKFAELKVLDDNSPVTIMIKRNGFGSDDYQTMEIDLASGAEAAASSEESDGAVQDISADEVDAVLQGTWNAEPGKITFDQGSIVIDIENQTMNGTYEINLDESIVNATFKLSDGDAKIKMPFEYNEGTLTLYNNKGAALTKID